MTDQGCVCSFIVEVTVKTLGQQYRAIINKLHSVGASAIEALDIYWIYITFEMHKTQTSVI